MREFHADAQPALSGDTVNPAGTNNRALLSSSWTFTFADGSVLSRPGGTIIYFPPAPGQTSRPLSSAGTLSTPGAQSQYAAGSHAGTFDIAQGVAAAGRDTNNLYDLTVTVVPSPSISALSPGSGPTAGGNAVTLSGTNFSAGGNAVTFGGTAATILAQSPTSITVNVPAHAAGAVSVVVTPADGQSATSGTNYTYVATPSVTAVAPTAGPTGGGTSVVVTGTNFAGATAVRFGAIAATSFVVNSNTQITATAPAGTGGASVNITVTTAGGTSATAPANRYGYVDPPTVTGVTPNAGPTSGSNSVTITGTNLIGATVVRFGATAASSFTVDSATQITATAPAGSAGTINVTVTTAGGTSATATANGYSYAVPPTVAAAFGPASIASGGSTTLTLTLANPMRCSSTASRSPPARCRPD